MNRIWAELPALSEQVLSAANALVQDRPQLDGLRDRLSEALGLDRPSSNTRDEPSRDRVQEQLRGHVTVVDGDTLRFESGERIRLASVDACESDQRGYAGDGRAWACGQAATSFARSAVSGREVDCKQVAVDDWERIVARCRVGGKDLAAMLLREGLAFTFDRYVYAGVPMDEYKDLEAEARRERRGAWAYEVERPSDFRRDKAKHF